MSEATQEPEEMCEKSGQRRPAVPSRRTEKGRDDQLFK